ncbi:hypothetical protein LshimejAT787_1403090 [Lyophyllum shimeji]|uniref:Uncharacterized protein n=1 Tax=Lyophyllum shimeji TaxID=47721 RepID=A0A9P3UT35_LYOSH|nr:hypothetical protein LshimejAT787_1403090 [Lyophyllum shimeji]
MLPALQASAGKFRRQEQRTSCIRAAQPVTGLHGSQEGSSSAAFRVGLQSARVDRIGERPRRCAGLDDHTNHQDAFLEIVDRLPIGYAPVVHVCHEERTEVQTSTKLCFSVDTNIAPEDLDQPQNTDRIDQFRAVLCLPAPLKWSRYVPSVCASHAFPSRFQRVA